MHACICLTGKASEPRMLHLSCLSEGNPNKPNTHLESSGIILHFAHAVRSNRGKCVGKRKCTYSTIRAVPVVRLHPECLSAVADYSLARFILCGALTIHWGLHLVSSIPGAPTNNSFPQLQFLKCCRSYQMPCEWVG